MSTKLTEGDGKATKVDQTLPDLKLELRTSEERRESLRLDLKELQRMLAGHVASVKQRTVMAATEEKKIAKEVKRLGCVLQLYCHELEAKFDPLVLSLEGTQPVQLGQGRRVLTTMPQRGSCPCNWMCCAFTKVRLIEE